MGQFPDEFSEAAKLLLRIDRKKVKEALLAHLEIAAAHLDLEGIAYIKLTRTGSQACFSMDVTSEVLKKQGFDVKDQSKAFWSRPAMEKNWDAPKTKVRRS